MLTQFVMDAGCGANLGFHAAGVMKISCVVNNMCLGYFPEVEPVVRKRSVTAPLQSL